MLGITPIVLTPHTDPTIQVDSIVISADLSFDRSVYSLETIKKAAYRYIDKFSADIGVTGDIYTVTLRFTFISKDESIESLVEDFRKEVLDQDLRSSIKAETESYRNLIFSYVFSKTNLVSNE